MAKARGYDDRCGNPLGAGGGYEVRYLRRRDGNDDHVRYLGQISGAFEGVGMEVDVKDGILTVIAPLKDTPAYKAGIKAGDKIIAIDANKGVKRLIHDCTVVSPT